MTARAADLFERGDALAALDAALRAVANEGKGRIALVCGEAGIGKTSVLRAFAAAHPSTPLWWGGCDALQTPHPLAPLHDIARESAGVRFGALLESHRPRAALFDAVLDELRLAVQPTLVVIDDAHWADDATLDLIRFLGRRIERTKVRTDRCRRAAISALCRRCSRSRIATTRSVPRTRCASRWVSCRASRCCGFKRSNSCAKAVEHHVAAVLAKLGVDSRGAAIALAQRAPIRHTRRADSR